MILTLIKLTHDSDKKQSGTISIKGDSVSYESDDKLMAETLKELFANGGKIPIMREEADGAGYFEYDELIGPEHPEYMGAIAEAMPAGYAIYELTEEYRKKHQQQRKTA